MSPMMAVGSITGDADRRPCPVPSLRCPIRPNQRRPRRRPGFRAHFGRLGTRGARDGEHHEGRGSGTVTEARGFHPMRSVRVGIHGSSRHGSSDSRAPILPMPTVLPGTSENKGLWSRGSRSATLLQHIGASPGPRCRRASDRTPGGAHAPGFDENECDSRQKATARGARVSVSSREFAHLASTATQ